MFSCFHRPAKLLGPGLLAGFINFWDTQKSGELAGEEAERVQAEICVCTQSSTIFGFSDLFISKWPFGGAEVDTWGRHGVGMVKGERLRSMMVDHMDHGFHALKSKRIR